MTRRDPEHGATPVAGPGPSLKNSADANGGFTPTVSPTANAGSRPLFGMPPVRKADLIVPRPRAPQDEAAHREAARKTWRHFADAGLLSELVEHTLRELAGKLATCSCAPCRERRGWAA